MANPAPKRSYRGEPSSRAVRGAIAFLLVAPLFAGCIDLESHVSRSTSFSLDSVDFRPTIASQVSYTMGGQPTPTVGDKRVIRLTSTDLIEPSPELAYGVWLDPAGAAGPVLRGNMTAMGTTFQWQGEFPYQTSFERVIVMLEPKENRGKGLALAQGPVTNAPKLPGSEYPHPSGQIRIETKGRNWTLTWRTSVATSSGNELAPDKFPGLETCLWTRRLTNDTSWHDAGCSPLVREFRALFQGTGKVIGREFVMTLEAKNATKPGPFVMAYASVEDFERHCNSLRCRTTK